MTAKKRTTSHRIALSIVCAMLTTFCGNTLSAQRPLDWGDQLNGTYKNPVLNADYSDPDVIRVGDMYYMVASDFHFMGMQVLESRDLVNWRIVGQVYSRFDYPGWDTNSHYGGGSWAPAIRYHDGMFYVYFCTPDEGLFMSTATDARGPWSPLHCVKAVKRWEDPCPFWDDDGQAYLARSQYGAGPIIVHRMSADGRQLLDDGVTVYTGPVAEGPKLMKRHGYYYILIPEGGVCCGWQTVLRSRNIYGPYEKRIVLEQGSTDINGPHQGALVDCPPLAPANRSNTTATAANNSPSVASNSGLPAAADTTWWFFHFQETHPAGRIVHMQPARWQDDWPLIGADIDGNGIGEPVAVWTKPRSLSTNSLTPSPSPKERGVYSSSTDNLVDNSNCSPLLGRGAGGEAFSSLRGAGGEAFSSLRGAGGEATLSLLWQWNHNPVDSAWTVSGSNGWLTFRPLPADNMKMSRNMLTQRTVGYESHATTRIDCSGLKDGDHVGLLCMGKAFMGVGVCRQDGRLYFYLENDGERTILAPCKKKTACLRVDIDSQRNRHQLYYSTDGRNFTPAGESYSLRMGYWKGSRIGIYSYTTTATTGGTVRFTDFNYQVTR